MTYERTCRICGQPDGPEFYENHVRCDEVIRLASRPFRVPAGVSFEEAENERIEWAKTQVPA